MGVHTAYRRTTASNIVQIQSQLTIPTAQGSRPNTVVNESGTLKYYNGGNPEFFHGFYKSTNGINYGLDAGLFWDGSWKICLYSFDTTTAAQWYTSPGFSIPGGTTVLLKSHFEVNYLRTKCTSLNGATQYAALDVYITNEAYDVMSKGCYANREMTLAMNADADKRILISAPVFFKGAVFTNTTLTPYGGAAYTMTTSNTENRSGQVDGTYKNSSGTTIAYTTHYSGSLVTTNGTTNLTDTTSATFDKTTYPI